MLLAPPLHPRDFPDWGDYYWEVQHRLTRDHLLPLLQRWGAWPARCRVLDIGCGDGGGTFAFAEAGARVHGVDVDPRLLEGAHRRAHARSGAAWAGSVTFSQGDITQAGTLAQLEEGFDIAVFRDVLEHIPDRDAALRNAAERLAPGGAILIDFPPYWSPYGGHQQTLQPPRRLGLRWAKLPYAHWLPTPWLRALARGGRAEDDAQWAELVRIRAARLTLSAVRAAARQHGMRVAAAQHYLLRPTFHLRYGLPVIGAGPLASVPLLREALVTGSYQLLARGFR